MDVIRAIPLIFDPPATARRLRIKLSNAGLAPVMKLIGSVRALLHPRAAYEVALIEERNEGSVTIGGVVLESCLLRKNLEQAQVVFPYIITVGPELEREGAAQSDMLKQFYLEELANWALEQAVDWLTQHIRSRFGLPNLSNMSPGSLEGWPITEQRKLFSIFGDTEGLLGVRLTESMFMVPRKSISGILFPLEEGFVACQLCERDNCSSRKAALDANRTS